MKHHERENFYERIKGNDENLEDFCIALSLSIENPLSEGKKEEKAKIKL